MIRLFISNVIPLLTVGGLLFLLPFQTLSQSGWVKGKGELFSKISYLSFQSDRYYTLSGNELTTTKFQQQALGLYGEYGLTNKLTLIIDWPAFKSQRFESTESVQGIGDLKLGLKYRIPIDFPISLSIIPELPIAAANDFAANKNIPGDRINLPTGDGEFNVYTILAASHSFYPVPVYINAFVAHNYRTKYEDTALTNQLVEGVEIGGQPIKKVWIKGGFKLQQTLGEAEGVVSFVRGEGTEYSSWFAGAFYHLNNYWGIDANIIGYINGPQKLKNIYRDMLFTIGFTYEIKK